MNTIFFCVFIVSLNVFYYISKRIFEHVSENGYSYNREFLTHNLITPIDISEPFALKSASADNNNR